MKPWPRLLLSFTLAVVWSLSVSAQTLLSGVVMDASKNPIEGASIQLSIGQKKTVAISITDERGQFSLSTKGQADSLYIIVSHISFEKKSIRLGAEAQDNPLPPTDNPQGSDRKDSLFDSKRRHSYI